MTAFAVSVVPAIPVIGATNVGPPPHVPPPGIPQRMLSVVSEKEVSTAKVAFCADGVFHV